MDLWIRSQNKELLMKCVEIRYNQKGDDHSILSYDTRGDYRILGIYITKERALEVLDEIQKELTGNTLHSAVNKAYKNTIIVYEIPKE